ncbi:MAG: hypothetical protein ACE5KF_12425, partial [Kiloniellaceae bacterium]
PGLCEALGGEDGGWPLGRVAAGEIARVASAESVATWIALARARTVRELRDAVREARAAGSAWPVEPDAGGPPGPEEPHAGAGGGKKPEDGADPDTGHRAAGGNERLDEGLGPEAGRHAGGGKDRPEDGAGPAGLATGGKPRAAEPPVGGDPDRPEGAGVPGAVGPPDGRDASAAGLTAGQAPSDDADDRRLVRFPAPVPVKAAFGEAVDLHRQVEGRDATTASFVEALVAEAYAGPLPPDANVEPLRRGPSRREIETRLAQATRRWRALAGTPPADVGLLAGESLRRFERIACRAGQGGPVDLDAQLRSLVALEEELEVQLGRLLLEMGRLGAWTQLGFSGAGHYAEERLGMSRTTAEAHRRLARDLTRFPVLEAAHGEGRLGFEAARAVVRLLGPEPVGPERERAWLDHAREVTVKRLRDEVVEAGRRAAGDPRREPAAPLDDAAWQRSLRREPGGFRARIRECGRRALADPLADVFLRLRLPSELAASFLSAVETQRRALAERFAPLRKAWWAMQPAREDGGRPVVPEADLDSGGAWVPVPWGEGDRPDGEDSPADGAPSTDDPAPAVRQMFSAGGPVADGADRAAAEAAMGAPGQMFSGGVPVPDDAEALAEDSPAVTAARRFSARGLPVPGWVGLLALLEDFADTWDAAPRRHADAVYNRDGWRCTAPGCTGRRNLEDHHLVFRSRGGPDDLSNRTTLCRPHHTLGAHGRYGRARGTAPLGIDWRLGRRDLGCRFRNERRLADATRGHTGERRWCAACRVLGVEICSG